MSTDPKTDRPALSDRRQQYAAAMDAVTGGTCPTDLIDAVLAVADTELARAQAEAHQYRTALQGVARRKAAPSAVPDQALRDRVAEALYERERPPRDPHWPDVYACDREVFEAQPDAVLSVLPPDGRVGVLLWAADALEDRGAVEATVTKDAVWAEAAALLRRLAAGERDEQQGGAEARDALMAAHAALAAHAGRQQTALARIGQMADHWEQQLPEVIRTPAVVSAIRAALERADAPVAEPEKEN